MLRDFQYNPQKAQLSDVLERFNLDYHAQNGRIDLLRFELLSPDSFVWKLILGNVVYYLYAEDYIPGLDYVKATVTEYIGTDTWQFVGSKEYVPFESTSPVQGAEVYQKPEQAEALMKYAVDSESDFVFLIKTLENPDDAHFPLRSGGYDD